MVARDTETYESLLKSMSALSGLFSQSEIPYIDSRFAERLFVLTTGAIDLGRADKSFDALLPNGIGVGVKTFATNSKRQKTEKIAEFTALAREGRFRVSDKSKLVKRVAEARNQRVLSNAAEYGIDINKSFYHCLIRFVGGAKVHEEPYQLIDTENLSPLTSTGLPAGDWSFEDGKIYFTDGISSYGFSIAKNVLMKRFQFDLKTDVIRLEIDPNPLELLNEIVGRKSSVGTSHAPLTLDLGDGEESDDGGTPGVDYVILPLYSTRDGKVPNKSGINQWNAGGRSRSFGEAYVPVPSSIHRRFPSFFPPRDKHFILDFPNGFRSHRAKICQDNGKALMTEHNVELGRWLLSVIDPSTSSSDFDKPPRHDQKPYSYADLVAINCDSVQISRIKSGHYSIQFAPIGSFHIFEKSL